MINPCYMHIIKTDGELLKVMDAEEALNLLSIMQKDQENLLLDAIIPAVRGKTAEQRAVIYLISKRTCIEAAQ